MHIFYRLYYMTYYTVGPHIKTQSVILRVKQSPSRLLNQVANEGCGREAVLRLGEWTVRPARSLYFDND